MAESTAEAITAGLRRGANVGKDAATYDTELREQARLFLTQIGQRVVAYAPHWWRNASGTVLLTANNPTAILPPDFGSVGTSFEVWVQGERRRLEWRDPVLLQQSRQITNSQRTDPTHYTIKNITTENFKQIDVWPTPGRDITLDLLNYSRLMPDLVDAPVAPGVTLDPQVGLVNGPVLYGVTFVHAFGETEGSPLSASVNPTLQQVLVAPIQTSIARSVTGRNLYRTPAGGLQPQLVAAIADNRTTVFQDNVDDGSLGINMPTASQSISGLEYFPGEFHESVFVDGLIQMFRAAVKQVPFSLFNKDWVEDVRRMWSDQRNDRHVARAMPAYGQGSFMTRRWRQLP